MLDQDLPHGARRDSEEVRPVLPRDAVRAGQSDECLVNEDRRPESLVGPLRTDQPAGDLAQLVVNESKHPRRRFLAWRALPLELGKESYDIGRVRSIRHPPSSRPTCTPRARISHEEYGALASRTCHLTGTLPGEGELRQGRSGPGEMRGIRLTEHTGRRYVLD